MPARLAIGWFVRACGVVGLFVGVFDRGAVGRAAESELEGAGSGWRAGAAQVSITPKTPMWMAGYASRDKPAQGQATELWAKALVLEDARGQRAALVTLDLVGVPRDLSQEICERLSRAHRLDRAAVALCVSHTHSGPVVAKNLGPMHYDLLDAEQQRLTRDYARRLVDEIDGVVGSALQKLAPARLRWDVATAGFAVNRRANKEADVPALRAAGRLQGPVDHDAPVLAVSGADGRLRAAAFGYACHNTVLADQVWSGDYAGYAQQALQDSHPGCVALFWSGCGGDQNPLPRRKTEYAQEYGRALASAVDKVLAGEMAPVSAALRARYSEIPLALAALPTREELAAESRSTNRHAAARAKALLEQVERGEPLSLTYPYPVQTWRLGDEIDWIFLGGEVVVDYAIRLKSERLGRATWVTAYANDVMAYIPSRRVLNEGGYEGGGAMIYYGLPTVWSDRVEQQIITAVAEQAPLEKASP